MRESPVHYIAPSSVSITPNCNGSPDDLAVYIARGTKIKVYCSKEGLGTVDGSYQEWTLAGRNRRLRDSGRPYTIYARLPKNDKTAGYLVFAPKQQPGGAGHEWVDAYPYLTTNGYYPVQFSTDKWYVRLGDVSLPENGKRSVTLDTGILGTEQYNQEWIANPDELPLSIDIHSSIDGKDAGQTPYVGWGQQLVLSCTLSEGWGDAADGRLDHWTIARDTGNAASDAIWPPSGRAADFSSTGIIALSHARGYADDFCGAVAATFTITAWGTDSDDSSDGSSGDAIVPIASATVTVFAETAERYELMLSSRIVTYSPITDRYTPAEGVTVGIRATDQRGDVFSITRGQMDSASLAVLYALSGTGDWQQLTFPASPAAIASAVIPISVFSSQQPVEVRLARIQDDSDSSGSGTDGYTELHSDTIAFLRDGEDSREREWIFYRSTDAITFGTTGQHVLPSLITTGEVDPSGAADDSTAYDASLDGWVPTGWYDEEHGVDETYAYEYAACRDYVHAGDSSDDSSDDGRGHWGPFTTPRIWSHFGRDGEVFSIEVSADVLHIASDQDSESVNVSAQFFESKGAEPRELVTLWGRAFRVSSDGTVSALTSLVSAQSFSISTTVYEGDRVAFYGWASQAEVDNTLATWLVKREIPVVKDGDTGPTMVQIYRNAATRPARPISTAIPPQGWHLTYIETIHNSGIYGIHTDNSGVTNTPSGSTWAESDDSDFTAAEGWRMSVQNGGSTARAFVRERIVFTPITDHEVLEMEIGAKSESDYDVVAVGKPNVPLTSRPVSVSSWVQNGYVTASTYHMYGITNKVSVQVAIEGMAGTECFIDIIYSKDSSGDTQPDCGFYRILTQDAEDQRQQYENVLVDASQPVWMCTGRVAGGTLDENGWQGPVRVNGKDAVVARCDPQTVFVDADESGYSIGQQSFSVQMWLEHDGTNCGFTSVDVDLTTVPTGLSVSYNAQTSRLVIAVADDTDAADYEGSILVDLTAQANGDVYAATLVVPVAALRRGERGYTGQTGRMFYMAGDYEDGVEYTRDDYECPLVHVVNNGADEWHYLDADTNLVGGVYIAPANGSTIWRKALNEWKVVITSALFAQFAHLGRFVVSGDLIYSLYGTFVYAYGSQGGVTYGETYQGADNYKDDPTNGRWVKAIDDTDDLDLTYGGKLYYLYLRLNASGVPQEDPGIPDIEHGEQYAARFVPIYWVNMVTGETAQGKTTVKGQVTADSLAVGGIHITSNVDGYTELTALGSYPCVVVSRPGYADGNRATHHIYLGLPADCKGRRVEIVSSHDNTGVGSTVVHAGSHAVAGAFSLMDSTYIQGSQPLYMNAIPSGSTGMKQSLLTLFCDGTNWWILNSRNVFFDNDATHALEIF